MIDRIAHLTREIAELEQTLAMSGLPEAARTALQADLRAKQVELAQLQPAAGGPTVGAVNAGGNAYIATHQTINTFFGGQPGEDGTTLLAAYLDALVVDCQRLRLHRLTGKRQDGKQQAGSTDQLRLQDVYTSLTTDGPPALRLQTQARAERVRRFIERAERHRSPDVVAPERVIQVATAFFERTGSATQPTALTLFRDDSARLAEVSDDAEIALALTRPELALEAIHRERRLVLLGEPGAGKSTVLRYLALLIAQRLRSDAVRIPGWPADDAPVPVVVPLGRVAAALRAGADDAYAALLQVIGDVLEAGVRIGLRRFLAAALRDGGVLLFCDGLDELSATPGADTLAPRVAVAAALRRLARETQARMVVTSRVLPYRAPGDWKLLPEDGWAVRTVQPLAFGQTRVFVKSWYAALAVSDPDLTAETAHERAEALIDELEQTPRLHPLVRSPLLLTMLAILHYNTGDVPRDRARLYEECVELLLDRWEPERQPGLPRESLIQRLGLPSLDPLRQVLHELAYQAHAQPPGDDGRGIIGADRLEQRMFTFFKRLGTLAEAEERVQIFLRLLDDDSGLLQRRGDEGYALPHLTFQEYLAACHLADRPRMAEPAYAQWQSADRERWREVLLLLMGRLHQQGKAEEKGLPWLKLLTGAKLGRTTAKEEVQRRLDAVLAALSYTELHERGAFAGSLLDLEAEIDAPLSATIRAMLETPDPALVLRDRIAAAHVLGELGDPRYPVSTDDWRRELHRRGATLTTTGDHYWRYVPAGRYLIGEAKPVAHDLAQFWIARLPITIAQFAEFVQAAYHDDRHWTKEGLKWRGNRRKPREWDNPQYRAPNQPMTFLTWYEATAFCNWLNAQLAAELPEGYVLRLPTEAEWEAAAAYAGPDVRRTYPWGDAPEPTLAHAVYNEAKLNAAAPVGCCPAGCAACGALDMAGNVWEWCSSAHGHYPAGAHTWEEDFTPDDWDVPLRGGSAWNNSSSVCCGARIRNYPYLRNYIIGFRVCVAPALA